MTPVALSEALLRAQVRAVRERVPDARVIGIHAPGPWPTVGTIRVDGEDVDVACCPSSLALRERLATHAGSGPRLVVVTDRAESDLGADVLARLVKRRLLRLEPWPVLLDLFHARELDPRLGRERWLAEALLETVPDVGFEPVPGGYLDADTVWAALLRYRLRLPDNAPDGRALLRWTLDASRLDGFLRAAPDLRRGVTERLTATAGRLAAAILRCVEAAHGSEAIPIGLVCRVLFSREADGEPSLREAIVRLEPALGGDAPESAVGLAWAEAAEAVLRDLGASDARRQADALLTRADALLRELRAETFAHRSALLPSGFEQRLGRCADAVLRVLTVGSQKDVEALPGAVAETLSHERASERPYRVETAGMAARLARRLRTPRGEAASFAEAASAYLLDGAFIDWARSRVWDGDGLPALAETCRLVAERTGEAREQENRRFATLLAEWTALGASGDAVLPIEAVVGRVVAPLARVRPVLLLVIDGMSAAVFHELMEDVHGQGWVELGEGAPAVRRPAIAALPTVTEVSRTSLLCGTLRRGTAQTEREGFGSHPALVAVSRVAHPPVLFHKGDLVEAGGVGLAKRVRDEIAQTSRQVVGVVINAVDDHLLKGDQLRLRWTAETIRPLQSLLDAARDAGRLVVLTSDHGHVIERDLVLRPNETGGPRYRAAEGAPAPDEILLRGPRVLSAGTGVIAPWSERVRYGARQNGYHGGASPQEVVVPVAVLCADSAAPPGWSELPLSTPAWWEVAEPPQVRSVPPPPSQPARVVEKRQRDLFGTVTVAQAPRAPAEVGQAATAVPAWIEQLLASATYEAQRRLVGRAALPEERVRQCLLALDERGGKLTQAALARALGVPLLRLGGIIAALRRTLNVDGYQVLSLDEASGTVELNVNLLQAQFDL